MNAVEILLAEQDLGGRDTVPLSADDLPGYAVRLYDSFVASPDLLRLATWSWLERVPAGDLLASFEGHDEAHTQRSR